MNPTLLKSRFDRLIRDPGDKRLLKGLAVEFGGAVVRSRPESLREYRVAAAAALCALEEKGAEDTTVVYARGVLSALLDAAACVEEALTAERERDEVRAVASRPLHRAALRALNGRALTTTAIAEQLDRHKSQMSEALRELETAGLITATEGMGGDGRGKPYRLTLTGLRLLDDLPADEPAVRTEVAGALAGPELNDWLDQLDVSFEELVEANVSLWSAPGQRGGRVSIGDAPHGHLGAHFVLSYAMFNAQPATKLPAPVTRQEANWEEPFLSPSTRHRLTNVISAG